MSSWRSWGAAASSWLLGGERGTGEFVFLVFPLAQRQAVQPLDPRFLQARRCATTGAGFGQSLSPLHASVYGGFLKEFPAFLARAVHTWKHGTLFRLVFVSGSHTSCVWVLPVQYQKVNYSGDFSVIRAQRLARQ